MQIRIPGPVPAGLKVIETMRAEPDGRIRHWPLHLERLRRDCAAVGFRLDESAVIACLAALPKEEVLRVRLTVDAHGQVEVDHQTLPPNPDYWDVVLSTVLLERDDPWLRIKTSNRPAYDTARADLPAGCHEAILLNEQGEICEGTITNVFLRRAGRLLTPAASCGLLPGVLRQSLLESGEAEEAILYPEDLTRGELFCGNALRGLIPARLQSG
ncbi:aminotransferase class IV [Paracoccus methylarcula]|nr:aminotransferase class IV [Paracoccus methylarcula]